MGINYCKHQFVLIEQKTRRPTGTNVAIGAAWHDEYGACVGCVQCGEIRTIWAGGELEIIHNGKDDAETSNTQN